MARRIDHHEILSALMDDSEGATDKLYLPGSEGDSDHLSTQSESDIEEDVEDVDISSGGESSSSQGFHIAGLYRSGRQNLNDLWASDGTGIEIFRCTMSKNRFSYLLNNMRFDDAITREDRIKSDRLAPIRDIFETFVQLCQNVYKPSEYLTLDEELVAFRGKCGFRQYIPSKPAKYGIKIYALVDAKTFYIVHLEIYCGKQPDNSPFALSNKPIDLVNRMVNCVSGSSRNITMDNFFTSHETANNLLQKHKLTIVGNLRANKACIPLCFKQSREEYASRFGF
ncbi:unnamed protein product [Arctia plantaginis]|uniref:PiggyBac transposable element-derived protein domain-containing protein n=1 Tax=Arctia plantaginis TaxID=874455 RepID=A0A8S0Z828_ARCPL|nr:unnamed protein product [Arctia plantaginis]